METIGSIIVLHVLMTDIFTVGAGNKLASWFQLLLLVNYLPASVMLVVYQMTRLEVAEMRKSSSGSQQH